jgi:hypothetical protein
MLQIFSFIYVKIKLTIFARSNYWLIIFIGRSMPRIKLIRIYRKKTFCNVEKQFQYSADKHTVYEVLSKTNYKLSLIQHLFKMAINSRNKVVHKNVLINFCFMTGGKMTNNKLIKLIATLLY